MRLSSLTDNPLDEIPTKDLVSRLIKEITDRHDDILIVFTKRRAPLEESPLGVYFHTHNRHDHENRQALLACKILNQAAITLQNGILNNKIPPRGKSN